MILLGKNITSAHDQLQKVPIEKIYHAIKNPKPETTNQIRQLRIIRNLDVKHYQQLKKQLPYLVCSHFNPPFRKIDNFAFARHFFVDIDNLSDKDLIINDVRKRLEADERVVLSSISPSEDGLKLLFKLQEPCYDSGIYSLFYKTFVREFSVQYHLEQVIDTKTCDVARACFISMDADVYYNPQATEVNMKSFLDIDNPTHLFDIKRELEMEDKTKKQITADSEAAPISEKVKTDVGDMVMAQIKAILQPNLKPSTQKMPVYVPEQLNEVMDDLQKYITNTGIIIKEIVNIQYGKKLRMQNGMKQAEVNVFYGRKGFSVVKSPRSGTNAELNELLAALIQSFFAGEVAL